MMRRLWLPVALLFCCLLAQTAAAELIRSVEIKGNKRIETDAILVKLSSKSGEQLSKEKIAEDIRTLHATGYFNSVQVTEENGVVTWLVEERPSVSRIVFVGNKAIDTDDLSEVLTIKAYNLYDENLVRESIKRIGKLYEERGYYLAKVTHQVKYNKKDDSVQLAFKVKEYERVKVKKITFLGNKAFTDDELKSVLAKTSEDGFFSFLTSSGSFKELDFKNDLQRLQIWYLNEGYVRFRHDPPVVNVSEDKRFIYVTIRVHEGEQYTINSIGFGGDMLFGEDELYKELELRKDDTFAILKRNRDVLRLSEKYQDLGYAHVNVVPDMQVNDKDRLVDITYNFEKGALVRFGEITVKGNSKTRDYVIRRELRIYEGELYSGTGMRLSRENVQRLGFFENETLVFNTKSPPGRPDIMDVEIEVKERPTGQFQLGAGYGTASKFFFTVQVAETNFRGKGQDLRLSSSFAANSENRRISLSFLDPYSWDTKWALGGSIRYDKSRITGGRSGLRYIRKTKGFDIEAGHPVAEYTRAFLQYSYDNIELLNVDEEDIVAVNLDRENGIKSAVKGTLRFDKRNNRLDPSGGFYAQWSEEYAGLGGNRNFLRSIIDLRWYYTIIGNLVFRTRFEAGNIAATSNKGIQTDERFFLGGAGTLRGYRLFSVSPSKEVFVARRANNGVLTQEPIISRSGGDNKLLFNAELVYPLLSEIGLKVVLFYDAGDAFDGTDMQIHQNWGWGLRWFSPLGPLRFEWGYPINPRVDPITGRASRDSEFYFNIGPPF